MPSTSLLERVSSDNPDITFIAGEHFEWQPRATTITYDETDPAFTDRFLHELGHATLQHNSYDRDIDLIAMERDAWREAQALAARYDTSINAETLEHDMDSYRDWLHKRSTCPACDSNGIQTKHAEYTCVTCRHVWRVNEARTCQLRRYSK